MALSPAELGVNPVDRSLHELDATALNRFIGSLFFLRETLRSREIDPAELKQFDQMLASALMIAVERRGVDQVMGCAQVLGWVNNGADILSLIEPLLRLKYESFKLADKEKVAQIPIVGVVGKIASGKGTVASLLSENYDVLSFPFSDRLRALALTMGLRPPYTREQLRKINDIYKPAFGKQIFVEWTLAMALSQATNLHLPELIVVDGFRSKQEAEYFLQMPNTHFIAVIADDDIEIDRQIRFERQEARNRGREDSPIKEKFLLDDMVESDWIDPVIQLARERGVVIYNNATLEDFSAKVMGAVSTMMKAQTKQL